MMMMMIKQEGQNFYIITYKAHSTCTRLWLYLHLLCLVQIDAIRWMTSSKVIISPLGSIGSTLR